MTLVLNRDAVFDAGELDASAHPIPCSSATEAEPKLLEGVRHALQVLRDSGDAGPYLAFQQAHPLWDASVLHPWDTGPPFILVPQLVARAFPLYGARVGMDELHGLWPAADRAVELGRPLLDTAAPACERWREHDLSARIPWRVVEPAELLSLHDFSYEPDVETVVEPWCRRLLARAYTLQPEHDPWVRRAAQQEGERFVWRRDAYRHALQQVARRGNLLLA